MKQKCITNWLNFKLPKSFKSQFVLKILKVSKVLIISVLLGTNIVVGQRAIVSFYNLENFYDTLDDPKINDEDFLPQSPKNYTSKVFKQKTYNMVEVLNKIGKHYDTNGVAIYGFAEFENQSILKTLQESFKTKNRVYEYVHYNSADMRGIDVGLFYQPNRFQVLESKLIPVLDSTIKYSIKREILYVYGLLDHEPVFVLVSHWPSRRGGEKRSASGRIAIAKKLYAVCQDIFNKNPSANIIVMGDFNDNPDNKSLTHALQAIGNKQDLKQRSLYNPFFNIYKLQNGSLAHADVWALFDQIIISANFLNQSKQGWHFRKAEIFKTPEIIETKGKYKGYPKRTWNGNYFQNGFSDHFPTYIVLDWQ
ncbi:MAG: endonuclease/exonuclease/phosphatase [Alphaproteobacteria bacterium]|nr:endonuclease/exonuclease/phosphatase [Alphaproteobacteria bacterium]